MGPREMSMTLLAFKQKYPLIDGLNISQMRLILTGEHVLVKAQAANLISTVPASYVAPDGRLVQINKEIRARNKEVEAARRISPRSGKIKHTLKLVELADYSKFAAVYSRDLVPEELIVEEVAV